MSRTQKKNQLNAKLLKVNAKQLQEWINETSQIKPELNLALEGIYCGKEGKIHEPLTGECEGLYITMGWYTVTDTPKVEYAYIS